MTGDRIVSEKDLDGRLLRLRLAAPPGNVIDTAMMAAIERALDAHAADPRLVALLIEAEGKHFSFGASVEEHARDRVADMLPRFHTLLGRLARLGLPTLAAVRGQCLGGGLELVACLSWIFAAPEARLGQPEIRLGVLPPAGTLLLGWRLGGARALDLCVSGRSLTAAEAHAIGLVHAIDPDPVAAARAFVEANLADKSPSSLRFAERAARLGLVELLETRLPALERLYLDELMQTHDANEGITAFLEKRPPRWQSAAATATATEGAP